MGAAGGEAEESKVFLPADDVAARDHIQAPLTICGARKLRKMLGADDAAPDRRPGADRSVM
jgi:hypothetical protein